MLEKCSLSDVHSNLRPITDGPTRIMSSDSIHRLFAIDLVLRRIIRYLEPRDIKTATTVCRHWQLMLSRQEFWRWSIVKVRDENISTVTKSERILYVGRIDLEKSTASQETLERFFRFIAEKNDLKVRKLTVIPGLDLSQIPADILSPAVVMFEHSKLVSTRLNPSQLELLFDLINSEKEVKLKYLNLGMNDLSSLSAESLARSLVKLEGLSLRNSDISSEVFNLIFHSIAEEKSILVRTLNVSRNQLVDISPDLTSLAMSRLKVVNFSSIDLEDHQWNIIFQEILESQHLFLTSLDISDNSLGAVSPELISRSLVRVSSVSVSSTELSPEQINAIMTEIVSTAPSDLLLKRLNIRQTFKIEFKRFGASGILS